MLPAVVLTSYLLFFKAKEAHTCDLFINYVLESNFWRTSADGLIRLLKKSCLQTAIFSCCLHARELERGSWGRVVRVVWGHGVGGHGVGP